jgi:predicted TIM-barrel fold metal-dependent hydrolase
MTDPRSTQGAVDVHVHFLPAPYREAAVAAGFELADGLAPPGLPTWSADRHLEVMDGLGIATSILSLSSPGVLLYDDVQRVADLARLVNDEAARTVEEHPGRFGFFATLPLPHVDASLAEIDRAFDELHADGVVLMSNYNGVYPADPALRPVLQELSRRNAAVLVHPTSPSVHCTGALVGWQRPMVEFFVESSRSISDLILTRSLVDNPGIRLIVAHAGAALPALASRIARNVRRRNAAAGEEVLPDFDESLRALWYDVAGSVLPHQIPALLGIASTDQIVYGSDWPFTSEATGQELRAELDETTTLTAAMRAGILRDNALRLFPRLANLEHAVRS